MNDFIYVPVGKDEFDEIMKSGDAINLVGGRDLKGEPRWLKKVPVSEYKSQKWIKASERMPPIGETVFFKDGNGLKELGMTDGSSWYSYREGSGWFRDDKIEWLDESISPIQEDWKEKLEKEAAKEEIFEPKYGGKDHSGYDSIMLYEVNDHRNECFIRGAEWAKQYIEENIINKKP